MKKIIVYALGAIFAITVYSNMNAATVEMEDTRMFKSIPTVMSQHSEYIIGKNDRGRDEFPEVQLVTRNNDVIEPLATHHTTQSVGLRAKKSGKAKIYLHGTSRDGIEKSASKVVIVK